MPKNDLTELGYNITLIRDPVQGATTGTPTGEVDDDGFPVFTPGQEINQSAVYHVQGYGIDIQVAEDDDEAWERLTNQAAHDSRAFQQNDPEATDTEILEKDLTAQVSLGDITQTEADEILANAP